MPHKNTFSQVRSTKSKTVTEGTSTAIENITKCKFALEISMKRKVCVPKR